MNKFKNKYRIPSARLQSWDYGANGAYFITICTQNRRNFFGDVVETPKLGVSTVSKLGVSTIQLTEIGQLAEKYWVEIPNHFPFIELGNFVVMPNHTHGILIINKFNESVIDSETVNDSMVVHTNVLMENPTDPAKYRTENASNKWKPNTIGSIINQYKRMVTINARKIHADFGWQSRFHDHIIRDSASFNRIQTYIENNPANWQIDKFYR